MRVLLRTIVLVALLALGVALFYVGREHRIFLDNKTIEADGKTFRAMEQVNVSVNGGAPVELLARDRDVVKTVGPSFSLRVEVLDSMGGRRGADDRVEDDARFRQGHDAQPPPACRGAGGLPPAPPRGAGIRSVRARGDGR